MWCHDIDMPDDLGAGIDHAERKLANARRVRDDAMRKIEASRRGTCPLSRDEYSHQKGRHGDAEFAISYWQTALRHHVGCYYGRSSSEWMREQYDMKAGKVTLTQVWQRWRDVQAARKLLDDLCVIVPQPTPEFPYDHNWGKDVPVVYVGTARERTEAQIAMGRTAGLYDIVSRAYDGRVMRNHDQTLDINNLVRPPKRPPPTAGKRKVSSPTRSTFIGA